MPGEINVNASTGIAYGLVRAAELKPAVVDELLNGDGVEVDHAYQDWIARYPGDPCGYYDGDYMPECEGVYQYTEYLTGYPLDGEMWVYILNSPYITHLAHLDDRVPNAGFIWRGVFPVGSGRTCYRPPWSWFSNETRGQTQ